MLMLAQGRRRWAVSQKRIMKFHPFLIALNVNLLSFSSLHFGYVLLIFVLQLNRATVHNPVTGKLEYANYRISKRYVLMCTVFCVAVMINNYGDDDDDDDDDDYNNAKNVTND